MTCSVGRRCRSQTGLGARHRPVAEPSSNCLVNPLGYRANEEENRRGKGQAGRRAPCHRRELVDAIVEPDRGE